MKGTEIFPGVRMFGRGSKGYGVCLFSLAIIAIIFVWSYYSPDFADLAECLHPYDCTVKEVTGVGSFNHNFDLYAKCYDTCISMDMTYQDYNTGGWFVQEECWCRGNQTSMRVN